MMWAPTTEGHLRGIKEIGCQRMAWEEVSDILVNPRLRGLLREWSRTYLEDDRPIAAIGAWPGWKGVASMWAVLTEEMRSKPITLCKGARHWIEHIAAREHLHRMQALIQPEHDAAIRWIHWLGFNREGLMERASPRGTDLWLYARIFPCG